MLTGALVRVRFSKDLIVPRYINDYDKYTLADAEALLALFQRNLNNTRGELEQDLIDTFGDEPGQFVRRGLIKLLDDRSAWAVESPRPPEEIREAVFAAAFAARKQPGLTRFDGRESGCNRKFGEGRGVVDAEFFHHRLAIAADRLQLQREYGGDLLAALSFRNQTQHLHFATRKPLDQG